MEISLATILFTYLLFALFLYGFIRWLEQNLGKISVFKWLTNDHSFDVRIDNFKLNLSNADANLCPISFKSMT